MSDATYSAIRRALLAELRQIAPVQERRIAQNTAQTLQTPNLARQIAQHHPAWPTDEIWRAIQDLFVQGVLLVGDLPVIQNPHMQGVADSWRLPLFTISRYGLQFLDSTKDDPDPYDASSILEPLRQRGIANDTVVAYVPEAARALAAGAFRGTCILVGVAAEAMSEELYDAFVAHLKPGPKAKFEQALVAKKNSAEGRWNAFVDRFPGEHAPCLGDELKRRFENVLEPQLKTFKQNRDDAAHRRATLISRYGAQATLAMLVPFGITAADIVAALRQPCQAP